MSNRIKKIFVICITILIIILIIFLFSIVVWFILIKAILLSALSLITILLLIPIKIKSKYYIRYRLLGILLIIVISILTLKYNISIINHSFHQLAEKLTKKNVCESFSTREKLSVYGLNIYMGIFGYLFYPNAAKETLMMIFKDDDSIREYESDFPLQSPKVNRLFNKYLKTLSTSKNSREKFKTNVIWNGNEYNIGSVEAEYALALNVMNLEIFAEKHDGKWSITVLTNTHISYASNYEAVLINIKKQEGKVIPTIFNYIFGGLEFSINEGLFKMLEDSGWLHPYYVKYKFKLTY